MRKALAAILLGPVGCCLVCVSVLYVIVVEVKVEYVQAVNKHLSDLLFYSNLFPVFSPSYF
jgi:hypothetical protein